MLTSAREHYARQQRITAAGLVAARKARSAGNLMVARAVASYQLLAARDAVDAVPLMLAEQGIASEPAGSVAVSALAGTASDGRPLPTLFAQAATEVAFDLMVVTQLQDAARCAGSVSMASNLAVTGYVRMLNLPSCSRCAVLAGKFYRWNAGFARHPKCDCRHIPSNENIAGDLTTNPDAYFRSLPSSAELEARYPDLTRNMRREANIYSREDIFGVDGSKAILDGADISQVVNARRSGGMTTAQFGKRTAKVTTEGTTSRGVAGKNFGDLRKVEGERYRRSSRPRVMPETIYEVATDRADAIRLLKLNGFIF